MTSLSDYLTRLNAELATYQAQIGEANRLLDAAGVGERGAGLHIRVEALVDQFNRLSAEYARLHGEHVASQVQANAPTTEWLAAHGAVMTADRAELPNGETWRRMPIRCPGCGMMHDGGER